MFLLGFPPKNGEPEASITSNHSIFFLLLKNVLKLRFAAKKLIIHIFNEKEF